MKKYLLKIQVAVFILAFPSLNLNSQPFTDSGISIPGAFWSAVAWGDYDNDNDLDFIITGFGSGFTSAIYENTGAAFVARNDNIVPGNGSIPSVTNGSLAWGDYDNDGNLDFVLTGFYGAGPITRIFRNNGDKTFTEQDGISLKGVYNGSVAWGDYDNDGDLDLMITGNTYPGSTSKIYRNNGNNTFTEQTAITLTEVRYGTCSWGDYDLDGDLDILLTGEASSGITSKVYRNNGSGGFIEQQGIVLPGVYNSSAAWGDYNNDGFLDILLTGNSNNGNISKVYKNNGNNTFTLQSGIILPGVSDGSSAWADYDNDGNLDILLTGSIEYGNYISKIYRNNGANGFIEQGSIALPGVKWGSVAWGDYDYDNDLDIILTGRDVADNALSKIYINGTAQKNDIADKPDGLAYSASGTSLTLSWNPVLTDETPSGGMTYNIQMGNISDGNQIISSHSSGTTGTRRIVNSGNTGGTTLFTVKNIFPGNYYWKVQAVDNGYQGGFFSDEQPFSIAAKQAYGLSASIIDSISMRLRWARGNGQGCVVFCKAGPMSVAHPVNGKSYVADNYFGNGDEIDFTGWYCVYSGRGDSLVINGLMQNTVYTVNVIEFSYVAGVITYNSEERDDNAAVLSTGLFTELTGLTFGEGGISAVGDYNNDGFLDILFCGDNGSGRSCNIYKNNGNNTFTKQTGIVLPGVTYGSAAFGDYDNDNNLDLLITGTTTGGASGAISRIYKNDGVGDFDEVSTILLSGVYYSSTEWGDYNNDGYIDFILTGSTSSYEYISKIYKNNGAGNFIEQSNIELPGVSNSSVDWGDYDNDGFLDVVITGMTEVFPVCMAKIYHNNGDNSFTELENTSFPLVNSGSSAWADYDNDGDLDILIAGYTGIGYYSKLFRNDGNNTFTEQTSIVFEGLANGNVIWGDCDNDGDQDILMTGTNSGSYMTKIYRNNGNNTFDEFKGSLLPGVYGSINCGDYDNDGDLDVFISGESTSLGVISKVYKNNTLIRTGNYLANKAPNAPVNLSSQSYPDRMELRWDPVLGDETPFKSLSYNVRMRKAGETDWNSSPHSGNNGYRRIAGLGNGQLDTKFIYKNLAQGEYDWSVQSIDQTYSGGAWSAISTFIVKNTEAFFDYDIVCQGSATHFTDQSVSTDGIASWKWNFDDGITSMNQNPVHIYSQEGTYNVKLVITDNGGIKDSLTQAVVVKARPLAGFNAPAVCQGNATTLTNTTETNSLTISSWFWDFGDGQTSIAEQPPAHGYLGAADYTVQLKALATNGCRDSITKTVTVASYPVAAVTADAPLTFCKGDSVSLTVPLNADYTYTWKRDNAALTGATSNKYVAKLTGSYTVDVVNTKANCLTASSTVAVVAQNAPVAPLITSSGTLIFCQGDSVILNVPNTSGYSYQWKLNGGAVGTNSYLHTAKVSGTYSLTVTNTLGCFNNATNNLNITVNPKPASPVVNLSGPTAFCQGSSVDLSVSSSTGFTYQWENNGAAISGATLNKLTANTSGVYALKITNNDNCFIKSENITVNVLTIPSAPTISASSATTFCQGDSVVLSVSNTPGYSYQWRLNGGSVGTNSNQFVAKTSGAYDIVVSNSSGCSVTSLVPVAVVANPLPVLSIITVKGEEKFCSGESTNLSVPANKDYIYAWKKGTGDLGLSTNSIDVTESGNYTVELNLAGCKLTAEPVAIEVVAKPARPDIDPGTYKKDDCLGDNPPVLSVDNLVPGYTYQWYKNETPLSNATSIEVTESGNYYLEAVVDICTSERALAEIVFPAALPKPDLTAKGPTIWILSTSSKAEQYKWFYNGDHIPTADNKSVYLAGQNMGTYRVAISNDGKCFSFSDKKTIPDIVGIEEPDPFKDVRIYPNPTTGLFTIEMNNNVFGELVIDIITQNGSKILNIKFDKSTEHFMSQIDLSGQPNGMYLINLSLDKFRAVRKVLVE